MHPDMQYENEPTSAPANKEELQEWLIRCKQISEIYDAVKVESDEAFNELNKVPFWRILKFEKCCVRVATLHSLLWKLLNLEADMLRRIKKN